MRAKHLNGYLERQKALTDSWWRKGLPTEEGVYWLYSYRYGKISVGEEQEPELSLLEVWADGTGNPMHICDGQFLYESEVKESYWRRLDLPIQPNEKNIILDKNEFTYSSDEETGEVTFRKGE